MKSSLIAIKLYLRKRPVEMGAARYPANGSKRAILGSGKNQNLTIAWITQLQLRLICLFQIEELMRAYNQRIKSEIWFISLHIQLSKELIAI